MNICNPFPGVLAAHGRGSSRAVECAQVVFTQLTDAHHLLIKGSHIADFRDGVTL